MRTKSYRTGNLSKVPALVGWAQLALWQNMEQWILPLAPYPSEMLTKVVLKSYYSSASNMRGQLLFLGMPWHHGECLCSKRQEMGSCSICVWHRLTKYRPDPCRQSILRSTFGLTHIAQKFVNCFCVYILVDTTFQWSFNANHQIVGADNSRRCSAHRAYARSLDNARKTSIRRPPTESQWGLGYSVRYVGRKVPSWLRNIETSLKNRFLNEIVRNA